MLNLGEVTGIGTTRPPTTSTARRAHEARVDLV